MQRLGAFGELKPPSLSREICRTFRMVADWDLVEHKAQDSCVCDDNVTILIPTANIP